MPTKPSNDITYSAKNTDSEGNCSDISFLHVANAV